MDMKPVYLPPAYNFSLEALKEEDYSAWERVQQLLGSLQVELFGYDGDQTLSADLNKLIQGRFLRPVVRTYENNDEIQVGFVIWSYLSKSYKHIEDMEDDEFDVVSGMLEYFGRVN